MVFLAQTVGLVQAVVSQEKYFSRPSPPADVLLYARYLVVLLGFIPTGCWVVGLCRRGVSVIPDFRSWVPVRMFFYSMFVATGVTSLLAGQGLLGHSGFLLEQCFITCQIAVLSLWAAAFQIFSSSWSPRVKRKAGIPDLWLGNLILVLVLSEAVVSICARYSTSPFVTTQVAPP